MEAQEDYKSLIQVLVNKNWRKPFTATRFHCFDNGFSLCKRYNYNENYSHILQSNGPYLACFECLNVIDKSYA